MPHGIGGIKDNMKPITNLYLIGILLASSVIAVGCGSSTCKSQYADCPSFTSTSSPNSNSGSGSSTGSGSGSSSSGSGSTSGSGSGGSSNPGPFTIGGIVSGLANGSAGFIIQDGAIDNLQITANGAFTFKTAVAGGLPYTVFVSNQPTSPAQTCTVTNGSGTASANVTNIQIACFTGGTASIGGNVVGLLGVGLVLQDNGGSNLAISASGTFSFATPINNGSTYNVTVLTQPNSPSQTCTVTNGSGTAIGNVGNIQITCSSGTISVGGSVSGLALAGSGMVLQDNNGDNLTVKANGSFTFPTLLTSGATYSASILTQPTGPNQTCTLTNGTGTATSNVTNIQIVCPAVFHTIGGTVVGLLGTTSSIVLQDNLGDNLTVKQNGAFTFNTAIADGSSYDVSMLVGPNTQPGIGCVRWFYQGTATSNVTTVILDCGHNDWSWFDGPNSSNNNGGEPGAAPATNTFTAQSPGGRRYPATWTDLSGNLWLFGGFGMENPIFTPTFNTAQALNDVWEYVGTSNYFGGFGNYWTNLVPATPTAPSGTPAPRDGAITWTDTMADATNGQLFVFGGEDGAGNFFSDIWRFNTAGSGSWTQVTGGFNQLGSYPASPGTPGGHPGSRWGATAKTDSSGIVWVFGGFGYDSAGTLGLLNDLWKYNTSTSTWTWVAGSNLANITGSYGSLGVPNGTSNFPGGRETSMAWVDNSGNFWLFGGYGLDSAGNPSGLNDLWEFRSNAWTWVNGANVVNEKGVYGTQGVAASTNVPGARWNSAAWTDLHGNLWLFGGQDFDNTGNGSLADLWEYVGGQWVWVKGPSSVSQSGLYGTTTPGPIIYPYVGDNPGTRYAPGYWFDTIPTGLGPQPMFWIFGGEGLDLSSGNGNGFLSDLWRYLPYP